MYGDTPEHVSAPMIGKLQAQNYMKKIRATIIFISVIVSLQFLIEGKSYSQIKKFKPYLGKITDFDRDTWFDVNKIRMVVTNRGIYSYDLITGNAGMEYPKGSGKMATFASGLWIFAYVNGELRCALSDFSTEYVPGNMKDGTYVPDNPDFQVYRINKGDGEDNPDWIHWRDVGVRFGAPVDDSGNPLLFGDQTLWTVFNDADPHCSDRYGGRWTQPLGIEVQMTVFGYDQRGPIGETVFLKWKIINKGMNYLDDMFIGLWFDTDLGDCFNDVIGCDIENNLGFCYNFDEGDGVYRDKNAAWGIDLLKGPVDRDGNILNMTSFGTYNNGTDPRNAQEALDYLKMDNFRGTKNPHPGVNNKYYANGDPVTGTGWLDRFPVNKRLYLGTGPIEMAPGDTQEVIAAKMAAEGEDRFDAITNIRTNDELIQAVYEADFIFKPFEKIPVLDVKAIALNEHIILYWNDIVEAYNSAGYFFEGYNIYQSKSPEIENSSNLKLIQTFDIENDVIFQLDELFDREIQDVRKNDMQRLPNTGLQRYFKVEKDYWDKDSSDGDKLINGIPCYFVVTALVQNKNSSVKFLESPRNVLEAVPSLPSPGTDYSHVYSETDTKAQHTKGNAEQAEVTIEVVDPLEVKGGEYAVTFSEVNGETVWDLSRGGMKVLTNQTNFSGDHNYPFIEGLFVTVKGITQIKTYYRLQHPGWTSSNLKLLGDATYYGYPDGRAAHIWGGGESGKKLLWHDLAVSFSNNNRFFDGHNESSYATELSVFGDPNSVTGFKEVPFKIKDIENGRWLNAAYYDNSNPKNGRWDIESSDPIIVIDGDYAPNTSRNPDDPYATWMLVFDPQKTWEEGDVYFIDYENFIVPGEDEFTFKTASVKVNDEELKRKTFKEKIRAIPNPYYKYSLYESSKLDRRIMFSPLPDKCTLKIFNLAGVLVKTIRKDDLYTFTFWDVKNEYNMPVSSGIYVFVVESKELGQAIGKMAIFMENRY